jgi:hypothetical protein
MDDDVKTAYEILGEVRYMDKNSHAFIKYLPSGRHMMITTQEELGDRLSWHVRLLTNGMVPLMSLHAMGPVTLVAHVQTILRRDRLPFY